MCFLTWETSRDMAPGVSVQSSFLDRQSALWPGLSGSYNEDAALLVGFLLPPPTDHCEASCSLFIYFLLFIYLAVPGLSCGK